MNASALNLFLKGALSADILKMNIQEEVNSYSKLMLKKGSSIPLVLIEDEIILIDKHAIQRLCEETLAGKLSNIDLAYICDCLTLGQKVQFNDEAIKDIIFEIADPEINDGYQTETKLRIIIENL